MKREKSVIFSWAVVILISAAVAVLTWKFRQLMSMHGIAKLAEGEWFLVSEGWSIFLYIWPIYLTITIPVGCFLFWKSRLIARFYQEVEQRIRSQEQEKMAAQIRAATDMRELSRYEIDRIKIKENKYKEQIQRYQAYVQELESGNNEQVHRLKKTIHHRDEIIRKMKERLQEVCRL